MRVPIQPSTANPNTTTTPSVIQRRRMRPPFGSRQRSVRHSTPAGYATTAPLIESMRIDAVEIAKRRGTSDLARRRQSAINPQRTVSQRLGSELARTVRREVTTIAFKSTLLELVEAVSDYAETNAETVATVVYLVNSGRVQLCGTFRGARFDLEATSITRAA